MQNTPHTAILVFTRTPVNEALFKKSAPGLSINKQAQLCAGFINHAVSEAAATGFDVIVIDSRHQQGETFGERLLNAMEEVFECGYKRVITIGTDTPELNHSDIDKVAVLLNKNGVVTGPSSDGGVYIIGLHRHSYNRAALLKISWQTSLVNKQLNEYARNYGSFTTIGIHSDIDCYTDLQEWLHHTENVPLLIYITSLFAEHTATVSRQEAALYLNPVYFNIEGRGPPIGISFS